ncbi:MAG TPA: peptide chain release factor N(5)-glutamine methyltransferase, partial [Nitrospirae bacterium]|nr:peptide chain release factor N(5)-glutamine methyltransferase [Nitrospirota bacterium]
MSRFNDSALNVIGSLSSILRSSGIPDASKEAELIICHVLGLSRAQIYSDNPDLTPREAKEILQIADLRNRGEPLQYLLGRVDFYGLEIKVGKGTLIPRPETEILVG